MPRSDDIERKLKEMDAGSFQKLAEAYVQRRYGFHHLSALGSQPGTDKATLGVPDAHDVSSDGVALIAFTTQQDGYYGKLEGDIEDCLDEGKTGVSDDQIRKVICCHTCWRLKPAEELSLKHIDPRVELVGPKAISLDLRHDYADIANDFLHVPIGNGSLLTVEEFVSAEGHSRYDTPQSNELRGREGDLAELQELIGKNQVTIVSGPSGCGKTRLALEAVSVYGRGHQLETLVLESASCGNARKDIRLFLWDTPAIVLVDDADRLTDLSSVLEASLQNPSLRLVMTVRDYAVERVRDAARRASSSGELVVKPLDGEVVRGIVRDDYGVVNRHFLDQIERIANGNVRLAVMAGMRGKEEGYRAIESGYDIMDLFFRGLTEGLGDRKLTELSVYSAFDVCDLMPGDRAYDYLLARGFSEDELLADARDFSRRAILDLLRREPDGPVAVRLEQQNLRDYLVCRCFVHTRDLSLRDYISGSIPGSRKDLVRVIDSLLGTFGDEDTRDFVAEECQAAWDSIPDGDTGREDEVMGVLHPLLPADALLYAERHICDGTGSEIRDLGDYGKANIGEPSITLAILCECRGADGFKEKCLPLLVECIEKGCESLASYKSAFEKALAIDENSQENGFRRELDITGALLEAYGRNPSGNVAFALLKLTDQYLRTDIHSTVVDNKGVRFYSFRLGFSEALACLRKASFTALGRLFGSGDPRDRIEAVATAFSHLPFAADHELDDDQRRFLENDAPALIAAIPDGFRPASYSELMLWDRILSICETLGIDRGRLSADDIPDGFLVVHELSACDLTEEDACDTLRGWDLARLAALLDYYAALSHDPGFNYYWVVVGVDWVFSTVLCGACPGVSALDLFTAYLQTEASDLPVPGRSTIEGLVASCGYRPLRDAALAAGVPVVVTALDQRIPEEEVDDAACAAIVDVAQRGGSLLQASDVARIESVCPGFARAYCHAASKRLLNDSEVAVRFFRSVGNNLEADDFLGVAYMGAREELEAIYFSAITSEQFDSFGAIFTYLWHAGHAIVGRIVERTQGMGFGRKRDALRRLGHISLLDDEAQSAMLDAIGKVIDLDEASAVYDIEDILHSSNPYLQSDFDVLDLLKEFVSMNTDSPERVDAIFGVIRDLSLEQREELLVFSLLSDKEGNLLGHVPFNSSSYSGFMEEGFVPQYETELDMLKRLMNGLPGDTCYLKHRKYLRRVIKGQGRTIGDERWRAFHDAS